LKGESFFKAKWRDNQFRKPDFVILKKRVFIPVLSSNSERIIMDEMLLIKVYSILKLRNIK